MSGVHEVERTQERNTDIAVAWTSDAASRDSSDPFRRWGYADIPPTGTMWPPLARVLFITGSASTLWALIFLVIRAF